MKHETYRGVFINEQSEFNPYKAKWVAIIKNRKLLFTDDAKRAAYEYDRWAKYHYGSKAKLNFPGEIND